MTDTLPFSNSKTSTEVAGFSLHAGVATEADADHEILANDNGMPNPPFHQHLQRVIQPNMPYVLGFGNGFDGVEPTPVKIAFIARTVDGQVGDGERDQVLE